MNNEEVMQNETPTENVGSLDDLIAMVQSLAQQGALEQEKADQIMAILQGSEEEEIDEDQEREEAAKMFGLNSFIQK